MDASGNPWLDYPYADDGLDIWGELEAYFEAYLGLYYKNDADVKADAELQAWWGEVKVRWRRRLRQLRHRPLQRPPAAPLLAQRMDATLAFFGS